MDPDEQPWDHEQAESAVTTTVEHDPAELEDLEQDPAISLGYD